MAWECGIANCGAVFDDIQSIVTHQATEHDSIQCKVCGETIPDGLLAIYHTFTEHSRAEYVRSYGANSTHIRNREAILDALESDVDVDALLDSMKTDKK